MRVQLHPQLIEDTLRTTAEFVRVGGLDPGGAAARAAERRAPPHPGHARAGAGVATPGDGVPPGVPRAAADPRTRGGSGAGWTSRPRRSPRRCRRSPCSSSPSSRRPRGRARSSCRRRGRRAAAHPPAPARPAQPGAEVTEAADRLGRLRQRLDHLYHGDHVLQRRSTRTRACSARWTSRWCTSSRPSCSPRAGSAPRRAEPGARTGPRRRSATPRSGSGGPSQQPNAAANSGRFESGPLTR